MFSKTIVGSNLGMVQTSERGFKKLFRHYKSCRNINLHHLWFFSRLGKYAIQVNTYISVLAEEPTMHKGGVASDGSATKGASPFFFMYQECQENLNII